MPNFKEFIKGFEEKPEAQQPMQEQPKPKEHEITEAKLPESRFLKNDPYYKLVEEKKPKAYREHLFYPEGGKIALHGTSGERLGEFASEDEIKEFVDKKYEKPQPKPKKTVGEDLQEMYEKEFFKQANGNKEDFVNHFINRFGVPKGSSKKREAEFYGKRFDELSANQPKEEPKAEPKRPMTNKEIRDEHLKIKEKMDEKEKELGRKVNKEEYDEILNEVRNAPQPKQGSFEQVFGEPKPLSEEDLKKADIAAEWIDSAYGYDGWRAEKLPNGNFLTNVHTQDPDAEPEEVSPEIFVEQFKELLDNEDEGFIDFLNSEHGYNIPVKTKARKK